MSSEEGQYYYKAHSQQEGNTCGVYFFTDPDKRIELHFNYLDVECDNGGLVSVKLSSKQITFYYDIYIV